MSKTNLYGVVNVKGFVRFGNKLVGTDPTDPTDPQEPEFPPANIPPPFGDEIAYSLSSLDPFEERIGWDTDRAGESVAISSDGAVLAVGRPYAGLNGTVIELDHDIPNNQWDYVTTHGVTSSSSALLGTSVDVSDDGKVIVGGAPGGVTDFGQITAYESNVSRTLKDPYNAVTGDDFGYSVAVATTLIPSESPLGGDDYRRAFAGSPNSSVTGSGNTGACFYLNGHDNEWSVVERITDSVGAGAEYGKSVDCNESGSIVVIGAPSASGTGAVYIQQHNGTANGDDGFYNAYGTLTPPDGVSGDKFGESVAVSGDGTIVAVGAPYAGATDIGAVYMYHRGASSWEYDGKLVPSDLVDDTGIGISVSLSHDGSRVAISPRESRFNYVYDRTGYTWSLTRRLSKRSAIGGQPWSQSTIDISKEGTYIAVGSPEESAVYVYDTTLPNDVEPDFTIEQDNAQITLTNTSTIDRGDITDVYWEFGDGFASIDETPTHMYSEEGTYNIRLTVSDETNHTFYIIKQVTIEVLPVASFDTSIVNLTVTCTDTSTVDLGSIVAWDWDFGDGNTSTIQDPVHTYDADGTYTVQLTVTNDQDETAVADTILSVSSGIAGPTLFDIGSEEKIVSTMGGYVEDIITNIDGTRILVGNPGEYGPSDESYWGAAELLGTDGSTWSQLQFMSPAAGEGSEEGYFGETLSMTSDVSKAVISNRAKSDIQPSMWTYRGDSNGWPNITALTTSNDDTLYMTNSAVSMSSDGSSCILRNERRPFRLDPSGDVVFKTTTGNTWTSGEPAWSLNGGTFWNPANATGLEPGSRHNLSGNGEYIVSLYNSNNDANTSGISGAFIHGFNGTAWEEQLDVSTLVPELADWPFMEFYDAIDDFIISETGFTAVLAYTRYDEALDTSITLIHVFTRSGTVWALTQTITEFDNRPASGITMTPDASTIGVSETGWFWNPVDDTESEEHNIYIYDLIDSTYELTQKFSPVNFDGVDTDYGPGANIALSADGKTVFVTSPGQSDEYYYNYNGTIYNYPATFNTYYRYTRL